jgi:Holin of 3TMs, for gene-transfer release
MSIVMDVVGVIIKPVTDLISEFIVDKDKAAELAYKVSILASEQAHTQVMGQIEVNKVEAANNSMFVAGWRPAAGWCCVAGMAINFLIVPLFGPLLEAYTKVNLEPLDLSVMLPVLLGMLGLTVARSVDKRNGVA